MCTSPIKIKNHSRTFVRGVDKDFLLVPCGKCPECRKRKSNDVYVRSFFEYEYTKLCGGFVQLITLTYNDKCLPRCTTYKIPCFSREDITKFMKRLRQALVRKYGFDAGELRYTLCCEYGGERQRPHYHIEFHVNHKIDPRLFVKVVRDCWHFGFVATTNQYNGVICNTKGLKYVSKYVSKDLITTAFFDKQINFLSNLGYLHEVEVLKQHAPFNRRSIGFGDFGMSNKCKYKITLSNLKQRNITLPEYEGCCTYALPLHYVRRMLYDKYVEKVDDFSKGTDKYKYRTSYFLNELGKALISDNISLLVDNNYKTFKNSLETIDAKCARYVSNLTRIYFDVSKLKAYLNDLTNRVSKDFCEFVVYYSGYSSLTLYNARPLSPALHEDLHDYKQCYDMKLKLYLNQNDFEFDCLYDVEERLLNNLAGVLNNETSKNYLDALFIFDFVFKYQRSVVQSRCIEFEKSYMYRKYVANI